MLNVFTAAEPEMNTLHDCLRDMGIQGEKLLGMNVQENDENIDFMFVLIMIWDVETMGSEMLVVTVIVILNWY